MIDQLCSTLKHLENSLDKSEKLEFELRLALADQAQQSHTLKQELANERFANKCQHNNHALSVGGGGGDNILSATSTSPSTPRDCSQPSAHYDLKSTFGTVSAVLMNYKYDELAHAHRRSIKLLRHKELVLDQLQCENNRLSKINSELSVNYCHSQQRTEILCCKYLRMQAKQDDERIRLQMSLNSANRTIAFLNRKREDNYLDILQNTTVDSLELFKQMKKNDDLQIRIIELVAQVKQLQVGPSPN